VLVTLLVGAAAIASIWWTILLGQSQRLALSLPKLNKRAQELGLVSDPILRDLTCLRLSSICRGVDHQLPMNARIFVSGMIGRENRFRLGYLFFMQNYLYPRRLEVSKDGKVDSRKGWFEGTPCDSEEELRKLGFDFLFRMKSDQTIEIVPLTTKEAR
jgi:hypothetical protein